MVERWILIPHNECTYKKKNILMQETAIKNTILCHFISGYKSTWVFDYFLPQFFSLLLKFVVCFSINSSFITDKKWLFPWCLSINKTFCCCSTHRLSTYNRISVVRSMFFFSNFFFYCLTHAFNNKTLVPSEIISY